MIELLRKAIEWKVLLEIGDASNQANIARRGGITRARVTPVMGMLRLVAEIQEHLLSMPEMVGRPVVGKRALRPISQIENTREHVDRFQKLVSLSTS